MGGRLLKGSTPQPAPSAGSGQLCSAKCKVYAAENENRPESMSSFFPARHLCPGRQNVLLPLRPFLEVCQDLRTQEFEDLGGEVLSSRVDRGDAEP